MSVSNKSEDTAVVKSNRAFSITFGMVLLVVICIAAGYVTFWHTNQNKSKRIVVIDIEKIIEQRKEEFAKKYSSSDINNATTKNEMSDDIKMFAERLEEAIALESRDKIILNRSSVVSNDVDDITEKVISHIWGK
jgi:hypothetical protein